MLCLTSLIFHFETTLLLVNLVKVVVFFARFGFFKFVEDFHLLVLENEIGVLNLKKKGQKNNKMKISCSCGDSHFCS